MAELFELIHGWVDRYLSLSHFKWLLVDRIITDLEEEKHWYLATNNKSIKDSKFFLPVDGIITDFEDTKKAIVSASTLPLSIIIVGKQNRVVVPCSNTLPKLWTFTCQVNILIFAQKNNFCNNCEFFSSRMMSLFLSSSIHSAFTNSVLSA